MHHATCSSCGAGFDVDFEPGTEFTCGACGAVVSVPAPQEASPAPGRRSAPPAQAARAPAGRTRPSPAPPRPPREPKAASRPSDAPGARKQKVIMWSAIGGTALVILVLGIVAMTSGNDDPPPRIAASPTKPPAQARQDAAPAPTTAPDTPPATTVEPPKPAKPRPDDPLGGARWDAEQPGAGVLDILKFADMAYDRAEQLESEDKRSEAAALRTEALDTYAVVIKREPDQARARDRLGFVKYDPEEAKKIAARPNLPRRLKQSVTEIVEEIERRTAGRKVTWPRWLSVRDEGPLQDVAVEWRKAFRDAADHEVRERAKLNDPFYKRAEGMASGVEGDVGPVLRRKKLEGPTFDVYPRKPFVLVVQRDKDYDTEPVADHWAEILMQLRDTFLARFRKLNLAAMDRPTPVLVLRYDTDYTKYLTRGEGGQVFSLAHFEPFSKRLVTWKDPDRTDKPRNVGPSEDSLRTTIFHEGTHQLVDYYTKTRASNLDESLWFSEGIADYFGGHGRSWDETAGRWRYEPGLLNEERIQQVGEAKKGGYIFKLKDLLAYRRGDFERDKAAQPAKTLTAYAQGWALVYLLSNWNDNKYRDKFDDYVRKEMNGESGVKAFGDVFGAGSIESIEKELLEMIDVLYGASKERKIVNGKLIK